MTDHIIESIDFTDGATCHYCSRPIPTGVAVHIMDKATLSRFPAGPKCAEKYASLPDTGIPNYTKPALFKAQSRKLLVRNRKAVLNSAGTAKARTTDEVSYLVLRANKLHRFKLEVPDFMVKYVEGYYKYGALLPKHHRHIQNLIAKCEKQYPLLTPNNLMVCYCFDYWLCRMVANLTDNKTDFIKQLLDQLHTKFYLSVGQISAYNRWAENRENFPLMDTDCFKEAIKADAAIHPYRYRKSS